MRILLSEFAGFCFGVKRAVNMISEEIEKKNHTIYTLGHIIHNEDFNESLEKKGVVNISLEDLGEEFPPDTLVFIRTHGITKETAELLHRRKISCRDATCPYVKKIHRAVQKEVKKAAEGGEDIVFLLTGDPGHPEVLGIISFAEGQRVVVLPNLQALNDYAKEADREKRHILLSQTTHSVPEWEMVLEKAKTLFPCLTVYDTICSVTEERQRDVEKIARLSDLMVIVGGRGSSNTQKLAKISEKYCKTVHIRNAGELDMGLLKKEMSVGVSAGASTPDSVIKEVIQKMSEINTNDEMSFEEMLDQSFRTLRTGEEVTGVVTSVFANEIHVDLGIKHTGVLPSNEVSDNESDLAASFHPGDEITVLIQKFNDAEGTVQVSKKKVDSRANWSKVQEASESGAILTGKVVSAIKGGVLVSFDGQNLFVPASLTGIPKGQDIAVLVGKEVEFKIIELDPARKRAVASIRAAERERREALAESFWQDVAVDKVYTGKVKSITSYGAFVDLGGVDGMVHITELSWKKIKNPAEVVSIGDEITVYVKEINTETKKISLGYKSEKDNPWVLIQDQYKAGDTATVKIVNLTPFGAFAEVIPGIDGLIHISQISTQRINTPADVLKIGDEVKVQIVDIDYENHKVSLSMRALLEEEAAEAERENVEANPEYVAEESADAE